MKIKKISILLCILLLISLFGCGEAQETDVKPQPDTATYRNVKVIEVKGSATLTRDKKQQSVYKQMIINGNDNIITNAESNIDLLLDSDKYARIYENSDVTFQLEGNTSKGAIRIYLNKGGINSKIENKLSADDCYEIHTPDAVMAVRGTEFEVTVTYTDNGRQTEVDTATGSVEITLLGDNGKQKLNEAGQTTVIESKLDSNGQMGKPEFKEENNNTTSSKNNGSSQNRPTQNESNVQVTKVICPKCESELKQNQAHLLSCGTAHYSCDGQNHNKCETCQKLMCAPDHQSFECNVHYPCDPDVYDGHDKLECGHYLCLITSDAETVIHETCKTCGTYACQTGKPHNWADCGCVTCVELSGNNHIMCEYCSMCKSDGKEHEMCEFCYACISDGKEHADNVCNTRIQ